MTTTIEFVRAEHQLLVLCSKLVLSEQDEKKIEELIHSNNIDIDYLIILAKKHKVLQLIANHLIKLDINSRISSPNKFFMYSFYLAVKQKNLKLFDELTKVISHFQKYGVRAVPLKGAQLVSQVYKDYGLRSLNDFDFLISLEDRQAASNCLKSIGYSIGMYNWATKSIDEVKREEELMWKMNVGNLYPHSKVIDDAHFIYSSIDLSYDVDLQKNFSASRTLIEASTPGELIETQTYLLDKIDFLIHLCIHLYKEATNVQWVLYHADLNLIKFCDVREYLLVIKEDINPAYFCERIRILQSEEAVFYTFYYLDYLYGESFSENFLQNLNLSDTSYLEKYGELDYDIVQTWKKSFYERFFALSNQDELTDTSKLEKIKKMY